MGSKDFNTFMDTYIDNIRTQKSTPYTSEKKKKKEEYEDVPSNISADSVYIIKKPKTFLMNLIESFTGTDEEDFEEKKKQEKKKSVESEREFEQEYDEISHEEEKKGLWSRFCSLFSTDVNESYEDIDDEEKIEREESEEKVISPRSIDVTLKIEVAKIQMSLEKLANLKPGNVIDLNVRPEDGVFVMVNDKRVARGDIIQSGDILAIKITEVGI